MELITSWQLYWFTRLPFIENLFAAIFICSLVLFICIGGLYLGAVTFVEPEIQKALKMPTRVLFISLIIGILGEIFVPTAKEAAAIWTIPKILENPQIQSLGTNTMEVANIGVDCLREILSKESK